LRSSTRIPELLNWCCIEVFEFAQDLEFDPELEELELDELELEELELDELELEALALA